jgi:hypothetical protein
MSRSFGLFQRRTSRRRLSRRPLLGKNVHPMTAPSKRWLFALLTAVALVAGACGPDDEPGPGQPRGEEEPQEEQGPPAANFAVGEVRVIDSQDRPEAGGNAGPKVDKVKELVNNYYNAAFVDPGKWGDGGHPELANLFTEEAKPQVGPRIGILALGEASKSLKRVEPQKQQIDRLTLYFDGDPNAPLGVVSTSFEATATPAAEGAEPVKVIHTGTFWLQPEGDGFRISAFNADINLQQGGA